MDVRFLDLGAAYQELKSELDDAVGRVLSSGRYLLGPETAKFEEEFSDYVGTRHCVALGSGLDALTIALRACGIGPGDSVIVPTNTFIATWLAATRIGGCLVPIEPSLPSPNIDLPSSNLNPDTARAVVAVDLYGIPCDVQALVAWASDTNLAVVEDAAQAHGATVRGRSTGSQGTAGCWSFYPSKNLGAMGDAGAITTNRQDVAEMARWLRNYGSRTRHDHQLLGYNSRMSEIDAAILRVKLRHLGAWNQRRADVAQRYLAWLEDFPLTLPSTPPDCVASWHLFVVQTPERDRLKEFLSNRGIETQIHYPVPPHRQGAYASQFQHQTFPVAERLAEQSLSLPIGPHLADGQVSFVAQSIREFFETKGHPHESFSISST